LGKFTNAKGELAGYYQERSGGPMSSRTHGRPWGEAGEAFQEKSIDFNRSSQPGAGRVRARAGDQPRRRCGLVLVELSFGLAAKLHRQARGASFNVQKSRPKPP
jgi:hypothetical protein